MLIPRTDLAIEFLQKWDSKGPWVLTAIAPEGGQIATRTFINPREMRDWVELHNGKRNLYFTINKVVGNFETKPCKIDVQEISVLHLDADPRVGEDIATERERIFLALSTFTPHPSIIVSSGAGFQAYWLLEIPIPLDGTEATAIEAEAYSVQLELLFGGDHCANCDRIMRIPGTINLPNAVKRKKGRVATIAEIIEWKGTAYPLNLFTKAPIKIQSKNGELDQLPGGGERVRISGNIEPIYVDNLETKGVVVSDHVKFLIIHGKNIEEGKQYTSRSEALFAVVCALVKAGASDDIIAGIIMNRENKISESVLDKPRPERYAAKQIQSAREEADDPVLRRLNSRHAVIADLGGRCRIISETFDHALKRPRISYQSFQDFMNRYCHEKVQVATDKDGRPVTKPIGQWWTMHAQRRQYETIVFAPGRDVPEAYNLWQGFACEAIPGECNLFLEHVLRNLCKENKEYYDYLIGWMARCVQQPDCPGEVAVILRGEMGTGKSLFAKSFGSLFGRHFLQVSDPKHLVGSFNSHLRDCVLLFGDEAFYAGDKKHESVLRALVTEEHLAIEQKGVDVFTSSNYTHLILASNSSWVVPAGVNERRFFVLDVGQDKMQDKKYFAAMQKQLNEGGREALLHFLLTYDLTRYEVRDVPKTAALQDQKVLSMGNEESWWYEKLEEGRILKDQDLWESEVMKDALQNDYILFMQRTGIMRKATPVVLGKFLSKVCPGGVPRSFQQMAEVTCMGNFGEQYTKQRRMYFYKMPPLASCREHWDKHYGGPFKWHAPLERDEQLNTDTAFK